jgi:cytidine deaminase
MSIDKEALVNTAVIARENAYTPYSNFAVGAAVLCADGEIFTGCNIENAAYSPSVCAERVAIFKARSSGPRDFVAIAVVGGKSGQKIEKAISPCGVCRQVLSEFCSPDNFEIYLSNGAEIFTYKLKDLLPLGFSKSDL